MITFKQNVTNFSHWVAEMQPKLTTYIETGNEVLAIKLFNDALSRNLTTMPFQIVVSPAGVTFFLDALLENTKKIVGLYLCEVLNQLKIKEWKFIYYHPSLGGVFQLGESQVHAADIYLTYSLSKPKHTFDLVILEEEWLSALPSEEQYMLIYLMLVDTLGELMCEAYVGKIEMIKNSLKRKNKAITMSDLKPNLEKLIIENHWQDPHQTGLIIEQYQSKYKSPALRMDILEGKCYCLELLNEEEFIHQEQRQFLARCGIGYYSIALTHLAGQSIQEIQSKRKSIEAKLSELLHQESRGIMINTARGKRHSYVDYFVYDDDVIAQIYMLFEADKTIEIIEL